jgi:EAL domain-containing protein (putative c-di-GMP-specific phosphodiesterase class I)
LRSWIGDIRYCRDRAGAGYNRRVPGEGKVVDNVRAYLEVRPVLDPDQLRVVYQPILDLDSGEVFSHEVLVRSEQFRGPPDMFEAAVAGSCTGALGRIIRHLAVQGCDSHPLFLNIHPNEFDAGWLVRPDDPIFEYEHDVYLEITESVPLSHFRLCGSVLREIRSKGINLAVDDLGAGYSNLKYISDLAPEVVKLDRALVSNLADQPRLRTLVTALVRLCQDLGARVVAEGIEQLDELHAVRDTGCHFGQGYLIAKPSPEPVVVTGKQFGL